MYVCQWHLNVPFGKQKEALRIMSEWATESMSSSAFKKARSHRILVGHIGVSASEIIHEVNFDSLSDWEAALGEMPQPKFQRFAQELAPYVVPGSQRWTVMKVVE